MQAMPVFPAMVKLTLQKPGAAARSCPVDKNFFTLEGRNHEDIA
jgi:hypothetical protein